MRKGVDTVKIKKIVMILSIMLIVGLYSGVIYANDSSEGVNIEKVTVTKNNKEVEILQSKEEDGYLQITQIGQNSQNIKVATSTFEQSILLCGRVGKGTELVIDVSKEDECFNSYTASVGVTGTFSETIELEEGQNEIRISYVNSSDKIDNYVVILIRREAAENIEQLKSWLDVPSLG